MAMGGPRFFEDFEVGTALPLLEKGPLTSAHLMRWSAAMENWHKIHYDKPFAVESDDPFEYDVQKRVPSVDKARDMLGFECTTTLDEMLDTVVPWIVQAVDDGLI